MAGVNTGALLIGPPEYGKTSLQRELLAGYLGAGEWVFAHDPHWQFSALTRRWDSTAQWSRAFAEWRAAPDRHPDFTRGASFRCSAAEVRELVVGIGLGMESSTPEYADNVTFPMVVSFDEANQMSSGATWITEEDEAMFANRRHYGLRVILNLTRPTQLQQGWYDMASDVYVFALLKAKYRRALEEGLFLPKGALDPAAAVGEHTYIHWKRKGGIQR